jgi:hypothetical protein
MRARFALMAAAAAVLSACGWFGPKEDARGTSAGSGVQGAGRVAPASAPPAGGVAAIGSADVPWVDPEPPGAQEIAEQVVSAAWNQDKVTHLTMSITTLVDTKTGLEGFATTLAPAATTLDQRLTRLGADVTDTEVTIRPRTTTTRSSPSGGRRRCGPGWRPRAWKEAGSPPAASARPSRLRTTGRPRAGNETVAWK